MLQLDVTLEHEQTKIRLLPDQGALTIMTGEKVSFLKGALYLLCSPTEVQQALIYQGESDLALASFARVVQVTVPSTLTPVAICQFFQNQLASKGSREGLPGNYDQTLLQVLAAFGLHLTATKPAVVKASKGKAQHRWRAAIAEVDFFVDSRGSQAQLRWHKRNEMIIQAGAQLAQEVPLNQDGSIGFAAKMGTHLRSEQQDKIEGGVTVADIILKSANEVGLFLYYGGANAWLEIKDQDGKTLNEWSI